MRYRQWDGEGPARPGGKEDAMVQVRLEVRTGTARFRVSVRAQSTQRAMSLTGARYQGGEVRVLRPSYPILSGVVATGTEGAGPFRKAAA
jgi:hypothetical protein